MSRLSLAFVVTGLSLSTLSLSTFVVPRVEAQNSNPTSIRSSSTPGAQQGRTARDAYRRLMSPMGSAANVRRGWYQENLSYNGPPVVPRALPVVNYPSAPYVVYIDNTPREPIPAPPAYEPPPIYIVQPQAAPTGAQPVAPRPQPVYEVPPPVPVAPPATAHQPAVRVAPRPTAPQTVAVTIRPQDAEVFLDDEPVSLVAGDASLDLAPGVYVVEVAHPDFVRQRLFFGVDDAPVSVMVDLTADRPNRRSRVK